MLSKRGSAEFLTYCGMFPFVLAAVMHIWWPLFLGSYLKNIIFVYWAVIVSFIAGIHWGIYLFRDLPINLFVRSNIIALTAWVSVVSSISGSKCLLILCFMYLLYIDRQLVRSGNIERWYMRARTIATSGVTLTLAIVIFV